MKKIAILFVLSSVLFSCGVSKDLACTLRFANTGRTLDVDEIAFKKLKTMKKVKLLRGIHYSSFQFLAMDQSLPQPKKATLTMFN